MNTAPNRLGNRRRKWLSLITWMKTPAPRARLLLLSGAAARRPHSSASIDIGPGDARDDLSLSCGGGQDDVHPAHSTREGPESQLTKVPTLQ